MRGRKPKATVLKLVEGNPGHRPLNDNEPQPEGDLKKPPMWLSPAEKDIWNFYIKNAPAGLLKQLDEGTLVVWVCAVYAHQLAAMNVAKNGVTKTVGRKTVTNPNVRIKNQQAQLILKAEAALGFSPSSRPRIKINPGDEPGDDDAFFD